MEPTQRAYKRAVAYARACICEHTCVTCVVPHSYGTLRHQHRQFIEARDIDKAQRTYNKLKVHSGLPAHTYLDDGTWPWSMAGYACVTVGRPCWRTRRNPSGRWIAVPASAGSVPTPLSLSRDSSRGGPSCRNLSCNSQYRSRKLPVRFHN